MIREEVAVAHAERKIEPEVRSGTPRATSWVVPASRRVRTAGAELSYEVDGEGEPLLCIAGFGCDLTVWQGVARLLGSRFRVIRFDNRGVRPHPGEDVDLGGLTIRSMACDALAVLDALGVQRAHVVGHSMGGQIAMELALEAPDRVATLTLLSSYLRPEGRLAALVALLGDLAMKLGAVDYARVLLPWIFSDELYAAPDIVEGAVQFYAENPQRPSAEVLSAQSRAILTGDMTGRVASLRVPALVAVAAHDALTPPALSRQLASRLPGAELVELPEGAHGFVVENAPAVARQLSAFFDRHPLPSLRRASAR